MTVEASIIERVRESVGIPGDPAAVRIVAAMSGGVDSSVVAALLKLAGFDVVGITLQLYDHGAAIRQKGACCAGQDIHDARRVAAALGIPHYVLDFESRFRQAVIDDFIEGYLAGTTPIPCVRCNQTVKFADLLERSRELGAAALATGHYVDSRPRAGGSPHRDLFTPSDMARDQSYFLFATTREQADFLRFPLGWLDKRETRRIAEGLGLAVASKPDSQDICFVPGGKYADLILKLRPDAAEPGELVHIDGRVLGRHDGIIHFTIGQRRGLGISEGEPLYVTAIEAGTRRVVVGPREALRRSDIRLVSLNWLGDGSDAPHDAEIFARIRSTRPPVAARLIRDGDGHKVSLPGGEYGVSPGQACVLYEGWGAGARLLGGGFIAREKTFAAEREGALQVH